VMFQIRQSRRSLKGPMALGSFSCSFNIRF
jgi:hypothetical protein